MEKSLSTISERQIVEEDIEESKQEVLEISSESFDSDYLDPNLAIEDNHQKLPPIKNKKEWKSE